jgi:hypothetical protein
MPTPEGGVHFITSVIPGWNGTRKVTATELQAGVVELNGLLPLLPKRRTIVLVGRKAQRKFIYDLWGDAVNTASRMESRGVAGRVQVTDATRRLLGEPFLFEERGIIDAKGIGELHTWFLAGRNRASSE